MPVESTAVEEAPGEAVPVAALEQPAQGFGRDEVDAELEAVFGPAASPFRFTPQPPAPASVEPVTAASPVSEPPRPGFEAVHASALTESELGGLRTVEPHEIEESRAEAPPPASSEIFGPPADLAVPSEVPAFGALLAEARASFVSSAPEAPTSSAPAFAEPLGLEAESLEPAAEQLPEPKSVTPDDGAPEPTSAEQLVEPTPLAASADSVGFGEPFAEVAPAEELGQPSGLAETSETVEAVEPIEPIEPIDDLLPVEIAVSEQLGQSPPLEAAPIEAAPIEAAPIEPAPIEPAPIEPAEPSEPIEPIQELGRAEAKAEQLIATPATIETIEPIQQLGGESAAASRQLSQPPEGEHVEAIEPIEQLSGEATATAEPSQPPIDSLESSGVESSQAIEPVAELSGVVAPEPAAEPVAEPAPESVAVPAEPIVAATVETAAVAEAPAHAEVREITLENLGEIREAPSRIAEASAEQPGVVTGTIEEGEPLELEEAEVVEVPGAESAEPAPGAAEELAATVETPSLLDEAPPDEPTQLAERPEQPQQAISAVFSDLLASASAEPKVTGAALQMEIEAAMAAAMAAAEAEEKTSRDDRQLEQRRAEAPKPAAPQAPVAPEAPAAPVAPAVDETDAEHPDKKYAREVLDSRPDAPLDTTGLTAKILRLPPKSKRCVGIDLGTMFSCVAIHESGQPSVIPSRQGTHTIPSIVSFLPDGQILVGIPAQKQQLTHPDTTIVGGKRLMGRNFHSHVVEQVAEHVGYNIVEGDGGEAAIEILNRPVSLTEISAHVLREIREYVRLQKKEDINRAVVTCPAYFNERQRQAVRVAGAMAGWHVERVLNEPTAAALAYGFGRGLSLRRVLVYDLGGGTFDASLLEIEADVYQVLASGGDTFLGGMDFDEIVARHLVELIRSKHGVDPTDDPNAFNRVALAAENVKRDLSDHAESRVHLEYFKVGQGKNLTVDVTVTRAAVEPEFESLVDKTLVICADVIKRAGLTLDQIEDVILVGGQTRAPIVRKKVREYFGKEPRREVHPDEAVAIGAANYAQSLDTFDAVQLFDTIPMAIGVGLPGGRFKRIIERDAKLPATHTYSIRTTRDDQTEIEVDVFQGDSDDVEQNEPLGVLRVPGLPKQPKGTLAVRVTFNVNSESILSLTAEEVSAGIRVKSQFSTLSTPDEVRRRLGVKPRPRRGSSLAAARGASAVAGAPGAQKDTKKPQKKGGLLGWFKKTFGGDD